MARVWPGAVVEENAIQVHVSALRKVLDDGNAGLSLLATVAGRGYRFAGAMQKTTAGNADVGDPFHGKPSIAVLPFTNLSGERDQEYFADGIAEDIITSLARSRWFLVIARNSSFAFKGQPQNARRIADELGVRYVLEGSVRRAGDRVRITAQLADATNGTQLWAERYESRLSDVFAVQDEITQNVAGAIEPELLKTEGQRATRRRTDQLNAWDLVRQGTWQFHQVTQASHFLARELFRKAVALDTQLAEAHMWLGRVNESIVGYGWSESPAADVREAVQSCLRGVRLDERDPYGHYSLAMSYLFSGALEQAVQSAERAAELSPSFALGQLGVGMGTSVRRRRRWRCPAARAWPAPESFRSSELSLAPLPGTCPPAGRRSAAGAARRHEGDAGLPSMAPRLGSHGLLPRGAWPHRRCTATAGACEVARYAAE